MPDSGGLRVWEDPGTKQTQSQFSGKGFEQDISNPGQLGKL